MGVDLGMALCVVPLDVLELGAVVEGRHVPVEIAHPGMQVRITGADIADVALEVLYVDGLELVLVLAIRMPFAERDTYVKPDQGDKSARKAVLVNVRRLGYLKVSVTHSLISASVIVFPK
jgi:hypothetical protein